MLLKSVPFWSAPSCPLKKPWSVPSFHSVVCPQFSEKPWSVPSFLEKTVVCPQFSQFSVPSFRSFQIPQFSEKTVVCPQFSRTMYAYRIISKTRADRHPASSAA